MDEIDTLLCDNLPQRIYVRDSIVGSGDEVPRVGLRERQTVAVGVRAHQIVPRKMEAAGDADCRRPARPSQENPHLYFLADGQLRSGSNRVIFPTGCLWW